MESNCNVVVVLDKELKNVLMCKREKEPYKGLLNLIGGKIEDDENGLEAAYRELWEETTITTNDIKLLHLMDFTYYLASVKLEVYAGILNKSMEVSGDENQLLWMNKNEDFFPIDKFAGEGNVGHIIQQVILNEELLKRIAEE